MAAASAREEPQREPVEEEEGASGNVAEANRARDADGNLICNRIRGLAQVLAENSDEGSTQTIENLREQRRQLQANKRALTKTLRNETRKRSRMLSRSAQLTNDDLVEVLQIRQARAAAKAKAKANPAN